MRKKISVISLLLVVLLSTLWVGAITADEGRAAAVSALQADSKEPAALTTGNAFLSPNACPVLAGYANSLEQPDYCVYFNSPPTTSTEAGLVEDYVDDYWNRYVALGFDAPLFTAPKMEARIESNTTCNGSAWDNYIKVWDGCFDTVNPEFMQYVTGHEVFHRVQFSHDPDWATTWSNSAWIYEGTARNMEDVSFANVDTWNNCLGVPFSYCDEVNDYLSSTNTDITSYGMRYEANLFWTFFREQFGSTTTEPQFGVDALVELWNQMSSAESVTAVNNTLAVLSPGMTFDQAFRQFTVANYTKDLTGLPDDSYNYIDEDQAGNPAPYGPLVPAAGGSINSSTTAAWAGQNVSRYGARYYTADPSSTDCPVITANFQRTGGSTEFYHVITQNGTAFNTHVTGSGTNWTQSFLNDGVTRVVAIIGGGSNSATVNVTLSCATPVLDIELPTGLAPAYVGAASTPDNIVVQVSVTNGSPTGPVVSGLTNSDFKAEVGGIPALVLGGGFVQEEYFLLIDTPVQTSNGPYSLEIFLEEPGTTTTIASDLEIDAVIYDNTNTDHVIITDVSGSMGWDSKLLAAQEAAGLYIDASNSSDGLGLVSYNHDVDDTLSIQFAGLLHRNNAQTEVNGYTASGATSIGDGLNEAVNLLSASPTGNTRCQFTLLSDGMENSPLYWANVETAVVGTGCPVVTVAFGAASNELLMQDIASATGGAAYYNDVFVSAPTALATSPDDTALGLGDSYLHALCEGQGCERLATFTGEMDFPSQIMTHTLTVDEGVHDLTAVLDWRSLSQGSVEFAMRLVAPDGTQYVPNDYAFENGIAGHLGFHFDNPDVGEWTIVVLYTTEIPNRKYQVVAYGDTETAVELLLPQLRSLATGDYVPLYAIWFPGGTVSSTVTAPNGLPTQVWLYDDGNHGDGMADDGFFGGLYTLVTQAPVEEPFGEDVQNPPDPVAEGAYRVQMVAMFDNMRRETQGSFAVPGADDENNDGVPDDYIAQYCPGGLVSDADLDRLDCEGEYFTGTDPLNSDSDFDGESDYSESQLHGLDPLNAGDDLIEAPDYVQTVAQNGSVLLTYDVKGEYVSMLAHWATSPNGPWQLVNQELPLTGTYVDATVVNGDTYYYCVQAFDAEEHQSAVVCSEMVEPRVDPVPPEAALLINGGAASTDDPEVLLTFVESDEGHEETGLLARQSTFDDISEVKIGNDPELTGATWQPFVQGIAWDLGLGGGYRTVYVRFKDESGNESVATETATILYLDEYLYLPLIKRQ